MFWIGWLGLFALVPRARSRSAQGLRLACAGSVAVFTLANAVHLVRHAAGVAREAGATATTLRGTWPHVDETVLHRIYFDLPILASERLGVLYRLGFPPFDVGNHAVK
jgi:hypothetical protein